MGTVGHAKCCFCQQILGQQMDYANDQLENLGTKEGK